MTDDQALERERLKGEIVGIASGFSDHQFKELLRYIDYIKAGGAAETDRRVAAYGRTCPYCGARPGEACHAKNKRDTYCKVPHLHRISNV